MNNMGISRKSCNRVERVCRKAYRVGKKSPPILSIMKRIVLVFAFSFSVVLVYGQTSGNTGSANNPAPTTTAKIKAPESSVTEEDYERCLGFCNRTYPAGSDERMQCMKGCGNVSKSAPAVKPSPKKNGARKSSTKKQ